MRLHVVVRGRVQGVGFRWFVREAARRLDLAGYVLNRRDGSVEVEAEGNREAIDALRRALEQGPSGAQVEQVEEIAASAEPVERPVERPFTILRS